MSIDRIAAQNALNALFNALDVATPTPAPADDPATANVAAVAALITPPPALVTAQDVEVAVKALATRPPVAPAVVRPKYMRAPKAGWNSRLPRPKVPCAATPVANPVVQLAGGVLYVDISTPRLPGARLLIDASDWEWVQRQSGGHRVFAQHLDSGRTTAATHVAGKTIQLQRLLLQGEGEAFALDGDLLDLRRCNLSLKTRGERHGAKRKATGYSSVYKGVCKPRRQPKGRAGKWHAQIGCQYKKYDLGWFSSELAAAQAYDVAAISLFGATARLNFAPPPQPQPPPCTGACPSGRINDIFTGARVPGECPNGRANDSHATPNK
jgi:hypothetical protein